MTRSTSQVRCAEEGPLMVGDHTAAGSHHARLGADAPAGTDLRCSLEEREGRRFRCDARHAHGGASSSPSLVLRGAKSKVVGNPATRLKVLLADNRHVRAPLAAWLLLLGDTPPTALLAAGGAGGAGPQLVERDVADPRLVAGLVGSSHEPSKAVASLLVVCERPQQRDGATSERVRRHGRSQNNVCYSKPRDDGTQGNW